MNTQWEDVPVIATGHVPPNYVKVTENGYGMLLAWIAGPNRCARVAVDRQHYITVVTTTNNTNGETTVSPHPRSDEDQRDVDEAIASYLNRFNIPPPPSSYEWYVKGLLGDQPADLTRAIGTTSNTENNAILDHVKERYAHYLAGE